MPKKIETEIETKIAVRDMDRNQIKALRKAGLDPAFVAMTAKTTAELIDWMLDNIYSDIDFAGVPYYRVTTLAMDTYQRAITGPEAKNS